MNTTCFGCAYLEAHFVNQFETEYACHRYMKVVGYLLTNNNDEVIEMRSPLPQETDCYESEV